MSSPPPSADLGDRCERQRGALLQLSPQQVVRRALARWIASRRTLECIILRAPIPLGMAVCVNNRHWYDAHSLLATWMCNGKFQDPITRAVACRRLVQTVSRLTRSSGLLHRFDAAARARRVIAALGLLGRDNDVFSDHPSEVLIIVLFPRLARQMHIMLTHYASSRADPDHSHFAACAITLARIRVLGSVCASILQTTEMERHEVEMLGCAAVRTITSTTGLKRVFSPEWFTALVVEVMELMFGHATAAVCLQKWP